MTEQSKYIVFSEQIEKNDFRKLLIVRQWLREQGFPAPIITDYPNISLDYIYRLENGNAFRLAIYPQYGDGAVCRYIEVGKREVPIYELQCNGEKVNESTLEN